MIDRATLTQLVAGADPAESICLALDPGSRDLRPVDLLAEAAVVSQPAQRRSRVRGSEGEAAAPDPAAATFRY